MNPFDIFYLGLVLVAFAGFALTLAYYSQRDRLPRQRPREKSAKQAPTELADETQKLHRAA